MLVDFLNGFLSYAVLLLIIVIVAGCGIFLGISMAKRKNSKNDSNNTNNVTEEEK